VIIFIYFYLLVRKVKTTVYSVNSARGFSKTKALDLIKLIFIFVIILYSIRIILFLLNQITFFKKLEVNKINSSEAGFINNKKTNQIGYSIQFIIIIFVFITFDLELLFIRRMLINLEIFFILFFILFVIITFFLE